MDPARPSFLTLPYEIRKRVYFFAHLLRQSPIAIALREQGTKLRSAKSSSSVQCLSFDLGSMQILQHDQQPQNHFQHLENSTELEEPSLHGESESVTPEIPKQLLSINKALHKEVQKILFSENTFVIRAFQSQDLSVLKILSDDAIRELRSVLIDIRCWLCCDVQVATGLNGSSCPVCGRSVLPSGVQSCPSVGDQSDVAIISEWTLICQRLAKCIVPGRLRLDFTSQVSDLKIAEKLLEPLKILPRLRHCAIQLGQGQRSGLRSLARATTLDLTTGPSKFLRDEEGGSQSRFALLPQELRLRILMYTHLGPFPSPSKNEKINKNRFRTKFAPIDLVARKTRLCCLKCTTSNIGCCCNFRNASYSPSCQCRDLPLDILLASWQLYGDAAEVLYSKNLFKLSGSFVDILHKLQQFRPETLKLFRQIQFDFQYSQSRHWDQYDTDFMSLCFFIGANFNLKQLLVVLNTGEDGIACYTRGFPETTMRILYESYVRIMRHIKFSLKGLADLHISLGIFYDLEPSFEEYVMGPQYDSRKGNRYSKAGHSSEVKHEQFWKEWPEVEDVPSWHQSL